MRFQRVTGSGVTRNSGPWTNMQVEPSLHFPYHLSPSAPSLPLTLPPPFHPSLPLHVLPFPTLPLPSYSQPFPSPSLPPFPITTAISLPSGSRRSQRQTHFCAIHSPKSANLLKVSPTCRCPNFHCNWKISQTFFAWNSGSLHWGGALRH